MNLPDIIKRTDRAVQFAAGTAVPSVQKWKGELRSVVTLAPGTQLTLLRADEFECLRSLPRDITWRVWLGEGPDNRGNGSGTTFVMEAIDSIDPHRTSVLFSKKLSAEVVEPVLLEWPSWVKGDIPFHVRLSAGASTSVVVDAGASYESRRRVLHLIKGNGVEIGPGLNPHILPSEKVNVRYVESASAEEWMRNYKKTDIPSIAEQRNLWSQYIVADAQSLSTIPDNSLDFIYSSHVFEHLMNPLGVLENWHRKLTRSGLILGVVPDCRYIFDLRQPPSTVQDWLRQRSGNTWKIGREQYERWCRFTAPYNTPEDLVARNYSIHVHFYTPQSFAQLCRLVVQEGLFKSVHLETARNHRDFGFVLPAA